LRHPDGGFVGPRVIYRDTVTGVQVWKVTHFIHLDRLLATGAKSWSPAGDLFAYTSYQFPDTSMHVFMSADATRIIPQKTISGRFDEIREAMLSEARAIQSEDESLCLAMGRHARELVCGCSGVLTHCNAGALATAGIGTATAGMRCLFPPAAAPPTARFCSKPRFAPGR